jgi:hypothetical protein
MKLLGTKRFVYGAWLVPALVVVAAWALPAVAADRVVICEEFTDND